MRRKKSETRRLRDKLEQLVRKHVMERDKWKCQKCGKGPLKGHDAQWSHVIGRGRSGIRLIYDPQNSKCLCFRCHYGWWHEHPLEAAKWFAAKYPKRTKYLEQTYLDHRQLGTIPRSWYQEQIERFS